MARSLQLCALMLVCLTVSARAATMCGHNCTSDAHCTTGDPQEQCTHCTTDGGFCVTPYGSCPVAKCVSNSECVSWTGPLDPDDSCLCVNSGSVAGGSAVYECAETLSGFCGTRCVSNADCNVGGGYTSCPQCQDGLCGQPSCAPNGTIACTRNTECGTPGAGSCACAQSSEYAPFKCQNPYDEWCGTRCVDDSDCPQPGTGQNGESTTCRVCRDGVCSRPKCGTTCSGDQDCVGSFTCPSCIRGVCAITPGTCGYACETDAQCDANGSCPSCNASATSPTGKACTTVPSPGCLERCNSVTDCGDNLYCNYCDVEGGSCTTYEAGRTKGPAPDSPEFFAAVRHERAMQRALGNLPRRRHHRGSRP